MKKNVIWIVLSLVMIGCSEKPTNKVVKPLPASVDVSEIKDATIPAEFTCNDFNWMGGNLTMNVFEEDIYDAIEVNALVKGDTLLWNNDTIIVEEITSKGDVKVINNGIEEGGAELKSNGGGTYRAFLWDDHSAYTNLGKAQLPLAEDFTIIDCGENPSDAYDTIRTDQKLYLENLVDSRRSFNSLNTKVLVENGMITNITRIWIP